ncbi:MAG TPA: hypothetical protein VFR98_08550, partial [Agromyces sp.]|nr:hypothetical protein [Agromyces sp.]
MPLFVGGVGLLGSGFGATFALVGVGGCDVGVALDCAELPAPLDVLEAFEVWLLSTAGVPPDDALPVLVVGACALVVALSVPPNLARLNHGAPSFTVPSPRS